GGGGGCARGGGGRSRWESAADETPPPGNAAATLMSAFACRAWSDVGLPCSTDRRARRESHYRWVAHLLRRRATERPRPRDRWSPSCLAPWRLVQQHGMPAGIG